MINQDALRERFIKYCTDREVSPTPTAVAMNVSVATVQRWIRQETKLYFITAVKIDKFLTKEGF